MINGEKVDVELDNCPFCGCSVTMYKRLWSSKIRPDDQMYCLSIVCDNCEVRMEDLPYYLNTEKADEKKFIKKFKSRWDSRIKNDL